MRVILFTFFFSFQCVEVLAQEQIIFDAAQIESTLPELKSGFLHGGPAYIDSSLVASVRPKFWRIGVYESLGSGYSDVIKFNTEVMLNINDLFMVANGITDQHNAHPWMNNWSEWDQMVDLLAQAALSNNLQIDWWDVWNEPDNYWHGTYAQYIECFRRTDSIIHHYLPAAKISGPEFAFGSSAGDFQVVALLNFIDSLHLAGSHVEGLSWHEFFQPESVLAHVIEIRDSLSNRPWASNMKLQITEYGGTGTHQIPGWNVGWLYYFEKANIDWSTHACWNETDNMINWSDCQYGLNSLFMPDHQTPQPNYWVHRAYAMLDSNRVKSTVTHENAVGLASIFYSHSEIRMLIGRYENPVLGQHNAPSNLNVVIKNYPFCSNCPVHVVVQRIPSNNVSYSVGLSSPVIAYDGMVNVVSDSIQISLPGFVDGDAYYLSVNPGPESILSAPKGIFTKAVIKVFPNPSSGEVQVHCSDVMEQINVYSISGKMMYSKNFPGSHSYFLSLFDFPSGIYFLRVTTQSGQVKQQKLIIEH